MATRMCPHCRRRITAQDHRCCYCGRSSESARSAQVIAFGPMRSGSEDQAASGVPECGDPAQPSPSQVQPAVDGSECGDGARDILVLRGYPPATWAFHLIVLALIVSFAELIFPRAGSWLSPARLLLAVAGQYVVLSTRWHRWSARLLIAGLWPVLMPRPLPVSRWSMMHWFFILAALATAVAQLIGARRGHAHRFREQPPPDREPSVTSTGDRA
jgi:hypothetical protein